MRNDSGWLSFGRGAVLAALLGSCMSSACTTRQLEAFVAGVDAATQHLRSDGQDDLSFGDWLLSQFDD